MREKLPASFGVLFSMAPSLQPCVDLVRETVGHFKFGLSLLFGKKGYQNEANASSFSVKLLFFVSQLITPL